MIYQHCAYQSFLFSMVRTTWEHLQYDRYKEHNVETFFIWLILTNSNAFVVPKVNKLSNQTKIIDS